MANIIGYGDQMVKLEAYGDQLVGPVPLSSSSSGDLESIYNALVAKGITPASESLADILAAINTIVVPSGTYTYPSGSTGGTVNVTNYAQVNASNVYAKGKADGQAVTKTGTYSLTHNGRNQNTVVKNGANGSGTTILDVSWPSGNNNRTDNFTVTL